MKDKYVYYKNDKEINVSFPILDDENSSIAKKYGMIQKDEFGYVSYTE